MSHEEQMDYEVSSATSEQMSTYTPIPQSQTQVQPNCPPPCKIVPLNLTSKYAHTWKTWEGIREFIQNWHDGVYDASEKNVMETLFATEQKVDFKNTQDDSTCVEYKAYVKIKKEPKKCYGILHYDKHGKRLSMINSETALEKKILLLGYTHKSRHKDVIGEFGEGLKVGALALIRSGHQVTMETNKERWMFELQAYEDFGDESGLVVVVSKPSWVSGSEERHYDMKFPPCPVKLKDGDTCCSISSVSLDEWAECRKRFLFLTPPNESVDTGNGSLLLDDQFRGQLFVKGTWVADWREDNLHTGVNFCELRIDRDRNAVSQPTEIDHKLSSMWPRALEQRSDLAGRYFDLLANNPNCRDVRHANTYAMTETTAALMAEQFRKVNDDAFPVIDSFAWQELGKVQDEIQRKVVRCNQTLLTLLHKSGRYTTLEEAREAMKTKTLLVKPFARLTDDQRSILQHGIKLANLVEPKLNLSMIDVIDTKDEERPVTHDKRIELPFWMLDIGIIHKFGKMCGAEKCLCREIRICNSLIALRRDHIPQKVTKHSREPGIDQSIMKIVSHFVSPECQRTSPYCTELHAVGHVLDYSKTHAHCVTLEEELRSKIKSLQIDLMDYEKNFQDELKKMRGNNAILEKQLMDSMVRNTDSDSRIKEIGEQYERQFQDQKGKWQKSIQDKDAHIKAQEDDILELEKDLNHKIQLLNNREKQLEGYSKTLDHKHTVMVEKVTHYRDKLKEKANDVLTANRTQEYASTLCNEVASICKDICTELEAQPYICNICATKRRSHVFLPCSHYKFCKTCADKIFEEKKQCPICKQEITSVTKIFE